MFIEIVQLRRLVSKFAPQPTLVEKRLEDITAAMVRAGETDETIVTAILAYAYDGARYGNWP
jgi:hypothetical protein